MHILVCRIHVMFYLWLTEWDNRAFKMVQRTSAAYQSPILYLLERYETTTFNDICIPISVIGEQLTHKNLAKYLAIILDRSRTWSRHGSRIFAKKSHLC